MRNIVGRVVLVGFGLFVSILFLEVLLRAYYFFSEKQVLGLSPARSTVVWEEDEVMGKRLSPSQSGWFVTSSLEYFSWIEVNKDGWRDVVHLQEKPEDVFRIVILGDSFVENFQVPLERTFFRQPEQSLNQKTDKSIEVLAIGIGNTGTAQQYAAISEYGLGYQPDLVLHLFFSGNDVRNSYPELNDNPRLPYISFDAEGNAAIQKPEHPEKTLLNQSKEFLKRFRVVEVGLKFRQQMQEQAIGRSFGYPLDYHVYNPHYSKDYAKAWDLTKKVLVETRKISEESGADYVLVALANNEQVSSDVRERLFDNYPEMRNAKLDFEKPDKVLNNFCAGEKMDCHFMLPFFEKYLSEHPQATTHYPRDGHWNDLGIELAADFLEEELLDYFSNK